MGWVLGEMSEGLKKKERKGLLTEGRGGREVRRGGGMGRALTSLSKREEK